MRRLAGLVVFLHITDVDSEPYETLTPFGACVSQTDSARKVVEDVDGDGC